MAKYKDDNVFRNEILVKFDSNIIPLEEYVSSKTKMNFRCVKHQCVFVNTPYNVIHSRYGGCPICFSDSRKTALLKTDDWYANKLHETNNKVIQLSKYEGMHKKIHVKCVSCGNEWDAKACDLLHGHGCKQCSIEEIAKMRTYTNDEFISLVEKYNPHYQDIEFISNYVNTSTDIKCKCKKCGNIWDTKASLLISRNGGTGCPVCAESKGEALIRNTLYKYNIPFESQKEFDGLVGVKGGNLSYDFYLPSFNTLIEYQGQYHDENFKHNRLGKIKIQKEHDRRKMEYAVNNCINLLEIWYWDYNNIETIICENFVT